MNPQLPLDPVQHDGQKRRLGTVIERPAAMRRGVDGVDLVLAGHGLGRSQLAQHPLELLLGQPLCRLMPEVEQVDAVGALVQVVVGIRPHSLAEQRLAPQSLPGPARMVLGLMDG